ncbi:MAG: cytochrome C [Pseudomonadota bacterium]
MDQTTRIIHVLLLVIVFAVGVLLAGKALSATVGDRGRGLAFARQNCSSCHAIQPQQNFSPVAAATPFQMISEVSGMTETALRVFFQTPHKRMPNLIISRDDQSDVISYILSLRTSQ